MDVGDRPPERDGAVPLLGDSEEPPVGAAHSRNTQTFSATQVGGAGDRGHRDAGRGVREPWGRWPRACRAAPVSRGRAGPVLTRV